MSSGIWLAASGAAAQMASLDATANNLANVGTTGFKADEVVFREHLIKAAFVGQNRQEMRYAGLDEVAVNAQPGALTVTGRGLDVAVVGDGFFAVQSPEGERYTRAGAFHVDGSGALLTADGHSVLGSSGPIRVSTEEGRVAFSEDGTVLVAGQEMGQLRIVGFDRPERLQKYGNQLLVATAASGPPQERSPELELGALESSNASVVKGMTDMVSRTRAFEALERAIEAFSEVERRAANDIAGQG